MKVRIWNRNETTLHAVCGGAQYYALWPRRRRREAGGFGADPNGKHVNVRWSLGQRGGNGGQDVLRAGVEDIRFPDFEELRVRVHAPL